MQFKSQDSIHTIPSAKTKMQRFVVLEDESQNPSKLRIPERSLRSIPDSSKLRPDKMLSRLAKDGVIFLRAPSDNDDLKRNALKLGGDIIRLLAKYEFIETIPQSKDDKVNSFILISEMKKKTKQ